MGNRKQARETPSVRSIFQEEIDTPRTEQVSLIWRHAARSLTCSKSSGILGSITRC
ncbi:hypothetical protein IQ276_032050 [Desmonostoc muscorum LEGE 12446]|uniref:Uncharacterized protein n=1 Tax=Desmonostoc muscorum LEGE 12446 TaxID=1828758 RepID=A0A8J7D503_DESMC|nr:hypothetical protein [Desmonostoc muscorum]MCF2150979.1 hypothetical protein [Desmonostoc muscorum LEGE 12446]